MLVCGMRWMDDLCLEFGRSVGLEYAVFRCLVLCLVLDLVWVLWSPSRASLSVSLSVVWLLRLWLPRLWLLRLWLLRLWLLRLRLSASGFPTPGSPCPPLAVWTPSPSRPSLVLTHHDEQLRNVWIISIYANKLDRIGPR